MLSCFHKTAITSAIPIKPILTKKLADWVKKASEREKNWVKQSGFAAKPGEICLVADKDGNLERVLVGIEDLNSLWSFAGLSLKLPHHIYYLEVDFDHYIFQQALIGWGLGAYQFAYYKTSEKEPSKLIVPSNCDLATIENIVAGINFVRDLINIPADDMMPEDLADVAVGLSEKHHASLLQLGDKELLEEIYPAVYTVGRGSEHEPRVIDMRWGSKKHPKVTLVGKGVCFDSGGLDLKPTKGMEDMKKDMGGAAHALGLAQMIMTANLPIRLRVLIPAIENSISGGSYHPGDVIRMKNGKTVEVANTDAEGRLILADMLTEACAEAPDLLIDFATLTGAATVALGPDIAAMFSNDDKLSDTIAAFAVQEQDPVWHLPLHQPYFEYFKSKIADFTNCGKKPYAGTITAALFLQQFIHPANVPWLHFDIMGSNDQDRDGRPEGGEAFVLRALFSYLRQRFSARH